MTPLENVLDAVYRATGKRPIKSGTPNSYYAFCPAHDDGKRPSLVISEGASRVVLCCQHDPGCSEEDVLRAAGLELRNLYPWNGDKSLDTVKRVVKGIASRESVPTKYVDLCNQTKVWVDRLPDDYSDPTRNEYKDGWKDGWIQVVFCEWDSAVSLAKNRAKRHPDLDLGPVIFKTCQLAAAAYRTKNGGVWDAGAKTKLLTYARAFPGTIPAIDAEVKNQLNGGDSLVGSALKEAGMPSPKIPSAAGDEVVYVPQAIPGPARRCLMCHADISHRRLDASYCSDLHGNQYRDRVPRDADDWGVMWVEQLEPLPLDANEDQKKRQSALEYLARRLRHTGNRNLYLEDLMINPPYNKPDKAYEREVIEIRERRHLETEHEMKSPYEKNMKYPVARALNKKRITTEKGY